MVKKMAKTPNAWVVSTSDKGRKKVDVNDNIYLKDGDEFSIELFNPTNVNIVAKITIDGNNVTSSGIVVMKGQRVYLDCDVDSKRKFLYKTYTVESNNDEVKEAIKDNGNIVVKFYDERVYYPSINFVDFSDNLTYGGTTTTSCNYSGNIEGNLNISNNYFKSKLRGKKSKSPKTKTLLKETGMTQKGDKSNTDFNKVNMDFENLYNIVVTYKLLPISHKPKKIIEVKNTQSINIMHNELMKLKELLDNSLISEGEFVDIKQCIISKHTK